MSTPSRTATPVNGRPTKEDEAKKAPRRSSSSKPEVELDVSKLHALASDQQELFLLNFVASFERKVYAWSPAVLKHQQSSIKRELLQLITLSTPAPSRVIRHAVARCFERVFTDGDRKILFETITELGDLLTVSKGDRDLKTKQAAIYCLGVIYEAAGDSAITLSSIICASLLKLLKSSSSHVALRAAICRALGKVVGAVRTSLDDTIARDIWRQSRTAVSSDRGAQVQINACWCLEQLGLHTAYFNNTADFDSLKTTAWKAGDSTFPAVRHASASMLSSMMIRGYSETASVVPVPRTPMLKRPKKLMPGQTMAGTDGEDSDSMRLASPTWKKNALVLELSLADILRQLSAQYVRSATTNRGRAAIISCYADILQRLDSRIVESNFGLIAEHLLVELLGNPIIAHHRYRLLLTRRFVQKLLGDVVGQKVLGEAGRIAAGKILINSMLKNYPPVLKERPEPSKTTLTGALGVLAVFIQTLGSAFLPVAELCRDTLIQVLQHPSYTVQIHASHCLRALILACPQLLISCASQCFDRLVKELESLASDRLCARRSVGYANGLSAVISVSSVQPLYSSLEMSSRVLKEAVKLLKASANEDLRISGTQIQVAWVLLGGLMSLGPNFVKIHVSQLLLLWRNSLPKPLPRENTTQRSTAELSFLVHVRECALGCVLSFLEHNSRLLTADISKRIATLLQNTIDFLDDLPRVKNDEDSLTRIAPSLQLYDLIQMVRRRVLQAFVGLAIRSPQSSKDILSQANLLAFAMTSFAEPEVTTQGSLRAALASTTASFEGIWTVADNYGFGVSGNMRGLEIEPLPGEQAQGASHWHRQIEPPGDADSLILSPVCGAREHDSVYMHLVDRSGLERLPDPPPTEVVNAAIAMFAMILPLQQARVQESVLEQLSTYLSAKSLQRDPGRQAAVKINIALALLGALKVNQGETTANTGSLRAAPVEKCLEDLLRCLILDPDAYVRNAAYEGLGRLCNGSGNTFTTAVVNNLVETIVTNREPSARAGCAMALASIHSSVGSMAAGFHLRKIHSVLMSLCSDPHPTVHFWAIEAMSRVAESASLTFAAYMPSTLGMLAQLWTSDTHGPDVDAIGSANAELELPTPAAIAHCIASLINVLGPDLQEMTKTRDLILLLVRQFGIDDINMVQGQALECWEHIFMYAPDQVDLGKYVRQLQRGLTSQDGGVHEIAVDGLYALLRRNAAKILEIAHNDLEDQIWASLASTEDHPEIRNIIEVWLEQTATTHTAQWISRCLDILTRAVTKACAAGSDTRGGDQSAAPPALQDEEAAGFADTEGKGDASTDGAVGKELLRWQTRSFALTCLRNVFDAGAKDLQSNSDSESGRVLQARVADVIRMAFLASTSSVVELRIGGLQLIDQVLNLFGRTPDPDFAEALLLEQYQAQIGSALTPAFGADSTPELAAAAISVCASFVATGLVTDVEKMGRILRLLVTALRSFTGDTADPAIGDLKGLSSNARRMIQVAVLSAWADLQVASSDQEYLVDVVKPHIATLTPLWLSALQDFARLRFEPDISSSMGAGANDSLDMIYAALNRQTLLKFYQDSWLALVNAVTSLIDQDSAVVFDALDRKPELKGANGKPSRNSGIDYRKEPVAFFFILYGIAFEALIVRPSSKGKGASAQTLEILDALRKILRPSVAGRAVYQEHVFSETIDVLDRLAQTENQAVQTAIIDIVRDLCLSHPSTGKASDEEHLSDDIEQLFELTRIILTILTGLVPNLREKPVVLRQQMMGEATQLTVVALDALVDVAAVFPSVIRVDLHACVVHTFLSILGTGACQLTVVPQALPIFKKEIVSMSKDLSDAPALGDLLRVCLHRLRTILAHAQRREAEASMQCARNTLLAATVLISSGVAGIPASDPILTKLLADMLECLSDVGLGKVAAGCMRSLLLLGNQHPTGQVVVSYILPRLIWFLTDSNQADPERAKPAIMQALVTYLGTQRDTAALAALCIVLPALLSYGEAMGVDYHADTAAKLLQIASYDQAAFKVVASRLSPALRSTLEQILRASGQKGRAGAGEHEGGIVAEPSIALKMNFG